MKQLREGIKSLLLAPDASMSKEHREHLLQRLDNIVSQLATLDTPKKVKLASGMMSREDDK